MNAALFVDSNIFVYHRDASEPDKQRQAAQWLTALWEQRCGRTSVQVLSEYLVTVTTKLKPGMPLADAWRDVRNLLAWQPLAIDASLLEAAYRIRNDAALSWWDALIVAAAAASGCRYLLTEDLQDNQIIAGVQVLNPFHHAIDQVLG